MTPIAQLVEPLREQSVAAALARLERICEAYLTELAQHNWNLDAAFPQPHGRMSRAEYVTAQRERSFALNLCRYDETRPRRTMRDPLYLAPSPALKDTLITQTTMAASDSFEAFVAKLNEKVGAHTAAEFELAGTWSNSVIRVVLPDGTVQRWKTQCILNVSKLGLPFNQWPTRKLK